MIPPKQLKPMLKQLFELQTPVIIVGKPGHAKSDVTAQAAAETDRQLLISHPAVQDPTDAKGLPWVVKGKAEFLPLGIIREIVKPGLPPTVVFLDDFGQAPPAVQAAWMQPILAREIEGHRISDNVTWILATNRREDRAGVHGVLSPVINRAVMLTAEVDVDSHAEWMHANGMPPDLVAFERFKPEFLTKEPGRDLEAFSSPRSLAMLGKMVKAGVTDVRMWEGAVGPSCATAYAEFRRVWHELPDVNKILQAPSKADVPDKTRPDILYALSGALAHKATSKNVAKVLTYIKRMPPEFMVACLKDAIARDQKLTSTDPIVKWASEKRNRELFGFEGVGA